MGVAGYRFVIAVIDRELAAPCVVVIVGDNIIILIHYLLDVALCISPIEVSDRLRCAAYIANCLPYSPHLIVDEIVGILNGRAFSCPLKPDELIPVENIAVGILVTDGLFSPYSVLIIIIIDGSTVYPRVEQLPAHLPSQGIASAVIVRERIAYLIVCDGMAVIRGEQILPARFIGVYIAVLCDLSA